MVGANNQPSNNMVSYILLRPGFTDLKIVYIETSTDYSWQEVRKM
jgi:hypothetical protein